MKARISLLVLGGLLVFSTALAQWSGFDTNVNVNPGSVNVSGPNGNTSVNTAPGSLNVNQNGKNVKFMKDANVNLNVNANGQNVQVNDKLTGSGGSLDVMVNGQEVKLDSSKDSLSVFVSKGGSLDSASASSIVSLQGNSVSLIKSDDDLSAYANVVVAARPAVAGVTVENDRIIVKYDQPGKFLGLFKVHLGAQAEVDSSGNVSIHLPWYSFLVSKNSGQVKAAIESGISGDKSISVSAIGDGSNSSVRVQNSAKVLNVMSSAVQGGASTSVSGNGKSVNAGLDANGNASVNLSNGQKSGSINIFR